jgi:hypothetical protein
MNTAEPRLLRVEVMADLPVLWAMLQGLIVTHAEFAYCFSLNRGDPIGREDRNNPVEERGSDTGPVVPCALFPCPLTAPPHVFLDR